MYKVIWTQTPGQELAFTASSYAAVPNDIEGDFAFKDVVYDIPTFGSFEEQYICLSDGQTLTVTGPKGGVKVLTA